MRWIKTVDDALAEARDADDHCCMQCTQDALTRLADEVERLRGIEARARRWLEPDRDANTATMYGRGCLDTAREILGEA